MGTLSIEPSLLTMGLIEYISFAKPFKEATESTMVGFMASSLRREAWSIRTLGKKAGLLRSGQCMNSLQISLLAERKSLQDHVAMGIVMATYCNALFSCSMKIMTDLILTTILETFNSFLLKKGPSWFFWLINCHSHVEEQIWAKIVEIHKARQR
eukprot:Gb_21626 [translate_table: standard]